MGNKDTHTIIDLRLFGWTRKQHTITNTNYQLSITNY